MLTVNQRIKVRTSLQIIGVGVILGLIYVAFSNGFSEIFPFLNGAITGLLLGLLVSAMELWVFTNSVLKFRFITLLLLRTSIYLFLISSTIVLVVATSRMIRFDLSFTEVVKSSAFQDYLLHGNYSVAIFYTMLFAFSINFTRMMSRKMGQGMLLSFITGTFYSPKIQERVVMFISIRNVNEISHSLNQFEFFSFLNEYFYDITGSIVNRRGIIYEYVEDHIVITWRPEKGLTNANCIRVFFDIKDNLSHQKEKYINKYNISPQIIGSLHIGNLVRAEIGYIKTQIVFHGDTMNTTARLLSKCEELDEELVVSAYVIDKVDLPVLYEKKHLDKIKLKGKDQLVEIYALKDKKLMAI